METFILKPNAAPVYRFLSFILSQPPDQEVHQMKKILDCGAGGPLPPLALFQSHGFESWGIDISEEQLEKARQFCRGAGIPVHLEKGDMRHIRYDDESFDYVYEHFSMCHLSKADTRAAVLEMRRVLKPGGLCFLGVISMDSWPKSLFGEVREPGEYWGEEDGNPNVLHSMLDDEEADELVSEWEILIQEKQIRYLREEAEKVTLGEWMGLLLEAENQDSEEAWRKRYPNRTRAYRYIHLYYLLKKTRSLH